MEIKKMLSLISEEKSDEEESDTRAPYLLVAIKDDGNGVILEAHSDTIEFFRDGLDDDEFLEAYGRKVPTKMGVYEWRGKIDGQISFEGERDYWLTGDWLTVQ